jgi:hypothetical protein
MKLGDVVYYNKERATVSAVDLPGPYGDRIEINTGRVRIITTPGLDRYLSLEPNTEPGPCLTDLLFTVPRKALDMNEMEDS